MATGWKCLNGTWYYLESNGSMHVGWLKDSGKWYWLDAVSYTHLDVYKRQVLDGGTWYYATGSGALASGWLSLSGAWYWLCLLYTSLALERSNSKIRQSILKSCKSGGVQVLLVEAALVISKRVSGFLGDRIN